MATSSSFAFKPDNSEIASSMKAHSLNQQPLRSTQQVSDQSGKVLGHEHGLKWQKTKPLRSQILPTIEEFFPIEFKSELGIENSKKQESKEDFISKRYPILGLALKDSVELDVSPDSKAAKLKNKASGVKQKQIDEPQLCEFGQKYSDHMSITTAQPLKYRIAYRLSHKFTLRFKQTEINLDPCQSIDDFNEILLNRVTSCPSVNKQVFIEKERDLVPLIELRQLATTRTNYLMIRDNDLPNSVIGKPTLQKKKNTPEFGITSLTFREMSEVERLSYPFERVEDCKTRGTKVQQPCKRKQRKLCQ